MAANISQTNANTLLTEKQIEPIPIVVAIQKQTPSAVLPNEALPEMAQNSIKYGFIEDFLITSMCITSDQDMEDITRVMNSAWSLSRVNSAKTAVN